MKRRKYNRTNKDLPLCGVSKLAIIVYLLGIAKIYKRDMDLGHSMIAKIKEADGSNKYWRKFWKKYKKEKK